MRSSPKSLARAEKKKLVDEELQRLRSKLEVEKIMDHRTREEDDCSTRGRHQLGCGIQR